MALPKEIEEELKEDSELKELLENHPMNNLFIKENKDGTFTLECEETELPIDVVQEMLNTTLVCKLNSIRDGIRRVIEDYDSMRFWLKVWRTTSFGLAAALIYCILKMKGII